MERAAIIHADYAMHARVSLIAGLDSPLERGTGTWDWNVEQESLIAIVGHTIH